MSWTLAGWPLAASATVFAISSGVVTALYFLALRRRPIEVPFVALWRAALADERSTRLFARLRRVLSWLLALALVTMVTAALADPRREGHAGHERRVVIAVDVSASMGAEGRMTDARREARDIVTSLGTTDRAIVIAMGADARPVTALTSDRATLLTAIDTLAPLDVVADLYAVARLSIDVTRGGEGSELVVISDGVVSGEDEARAHLEGAHLSARHVRVGHAQANVAITALSIRRYPLDVTRNEVLLEVTSASDDDASVEVELRGDGETVDVIPIEIPARRRVRRFFADLTGIDRTLEARLHTSSDALAADDVFYARVPPRRRVRVAVVSDDDIYLDAALLLDEYLDVRSLPPSAFPPAEPFDVAILDRFVPTTPLSTDAIWIDPQPTPEAAGPLEVRGTIDRPFFDRLMREHPLLRHAALSDVNVARALEVQPRAEDTIVAADARGPLIVAGERDGHRFVAITFDVRESDLPLRPAFPLLLLDAIDSFAPSDAAYRGSVSTGAPASIELPPAATAASVDERHLPVRDGRASVRFDHAGVHTLHTDAGDVEIAANLDTARELDLAPRSLGLGTEAPATLGIGSDTERAPWEWMVIAALTLLLIEWATFHRRWTV